MTEKELNEKLIGKIVERVDFRTIYFTDGSELYINASCGYEGSPDVYYELTDNNISAVQL